MGISKILCPIDFSPTAAQALRAAQKLATTTGAHLVIAHAWQVPAIYYGELAFPSDVIQQLAEDAERNLGAALEETRAAGITNATSTMLRGPAWPAIVALLEEDPGFDLVVIGTHGRGGVARVVMGSVAEQVVRHAPCSVLAIHAQNTGGPYRNILVPVDFSESSDAAVDLACELAGTGKVTLLHVLELPVNYNGEPMATDFLRDLDKRSADHMQARIEKLAPRTSAALSARTRIGSPGRQTLALLDSEPEFDLVVMGSHGRTGVKRLLLGSVAEKVVRHAPCPVLVTRKR